MHQASARAWWKYLAVTAAAAVLAVYATRFAAPLAVSLGLVSRAGEGSVQAVSMICAIVLWTALASLLVSKVFARPVRPVGVLGCERGVVLAEIVLVLPILIVICGTLIQMILILNALMVVNFAAVSAARAASISYERSGFQPHEYPAALIEPRTFDAACYVLATISPSSGVRNPLAGAGGDDRNPGAPPSGEGPPAGQAPTDPMAIALETLLGSIDPIYGARTIGLRVAYARSATTVTIEDWIPSSPFEFSNSRELAPPREVLVTVQYDFFLALNGLAFLPGLSEPMPGNTQGRIFPISASKLTMSSGTRVPAPGAAIGPPPRP